MNIVEEYKKKKKLGPDNDKPSTKPAMVRYGRIIDVAKDDDGDEITLVRVRLDNGTLLLGGRFVQLAHPMREISALYAGESMSGWGVQVFSDQSERSPIVRIIATTEDMTVADEDSSGNMNQDNVLSALKRRKVAKRIERNLSPPSNLFQMV